VLPSVPAGWIVGIGDKNGTYITRSQGHDEFTGQPGLPEYLKNTAGRSGTFVSSNFGGVRLLAGYRRPEFSGWLFAANIPLDVVEAPLKKSITAMGAVALIAMLLSASLAYFFGAGFTRAAMDLAARAQALGEGKPVEPVKTSVREFARIGEALREAQHSLETRKSELQTVLETVPAAVWFTYDPQARDVIRNRYAAELMGLPAKDHRSYGVPDRVIDTIAMKDGQLVSREDRPLSRAMRGEQTDNEEFAYKLPNGVERHLMSSARSIHDNEGNVVGAVQISLDITARKREEEQRILLVNELNHRVKNTLAVVQAIASQTMRTANNFSQARLSLESRLVSLSKAHDILTRESWNGADLQELLTDSIAPHASMERVKIAGPRVWLPPNLALSLSLVAHELATNAIKYGALANMTGIITINWKTTRPPGGLERLHIDWRETGGRPVIKPQGEGFGSRILPGILQPECGSVKFSFEPAGVTCEIEANLELAGQSAEPRLLRSVP
jgi:PAS domain S-box-containing protein